MERGTVGQFDLESETLAFLDDLFVRGRAADAVEADRARRRLNLEPETARMLSILARSGRRTRLLEVGTSNGYSTIWLAAAASQFGGRLTSLERDPAKQAEADANLRHVGLRDVVDLRLGEATPLISALDGPFDFVFFDADRLSAPAQLDMLRPKLLPGALVLADNVLSHPEDMAGYLEAVSSRPEFDHLVLPVGKGLSVSYLRPVGPGLEGLSRHRPAS